MSRQHKPSPNRLTSEQVASVRRKLSAEPSTLDNVTPQQRPVPFLAKAKHAGQAAARAARAKMRGEKLRLPKRIRKQRKTICQACEFWRPRGNLYLGECTHPQCGCTRLKRGLATETCPAGKWSDLRG